jgi:NAD(P)-dependent dehydrogenase (short-subunit alcohol dehydrogenase family)
MTSVRTAAQTILTDHTIPKIDVIINNAGIMACPYRATEDGLEHQFATNYLSHFLLTNLLMPKILASSHRRVINVSSAAHLTSDVRYADPGFSGGQTYSPIFAYAQSKTANTLFSVELNKKLGEKGLISFSRHPAAVDTGLAQYFTKEMMDEGLAMWEKMGKVKPLRKNLGQACATTLRAALDPGLVGEGVYLEDCQVTTKPEVVAPFALDDKNAAKCWKLAEEMVGEKFEY